MVDFVTRTEEVELVSDLLWSLGVVAIEERDSTSSTVTLRTSMGTDPHNAITEVLQAFPSTTATRVHIDRSVADTWRAHAEPTWITDSVVLVPVWVPAPSSSTPIFIEPSDTFGLGNHPTTVLTLRLALEHVPDGSNLFDLGCGSGVLAIAMAKLKNCSAIVFDIAANAEQVVRHNCELNSVHTVTWSESGPTQVDAVLANILAPVLIEKAATIQNAVRGEGVIVLSGMRDDQVDTVLEHFTESSELVRQSLEGWTAVVLKKK